jgi:hypothetical protein
VRLAYCTFSQCFATDGQSISLENGNRTLLKQLSCEECRAVYIESDSGIEIVKVNHILVDVVNFTSCSVEGHGGALSIAGFRNQTRFRCRLLTMNECYGRSVLFATAFTNSIVMNCQFIQNRVWQATVAIRTMRMPATEPETIEFRTCIFDSNSRDLFSDFAVQVNNCTFSIALPDRNMWYGEGNRVREKPHPKAPRLSIGEIMASVVGVVILGVGVATLIYWLQSEPPKSDPNPHEENLQTDLNP